MSQLQQSEEIDLIGDLEIQFSNRDQGSVITVPIKKDVSKPRLSSKSQESNGRRLIFDS